MHQQEGKEKFRPDQVGGWAKSGGLRATKPPDGQITLQ
jgi:hypothetical protein